MKNKPSNNTDTAFHLISQHLDQSKLTHVEDVDTVCAFTGMPITKGIHKKYAIKDTFTDYDHLKYHSDYIGLDVASTMAEIIPGNKKDTSLRNYSFIANTFELKLLKNHDILHYIVNPLKPPFYFCISFNNKKHLAFKARLNYSENDYIVTTDAGECRIQKKELSQVLPVLYRWYTVMPGKEDTKAQPTWFTKEEILKGVNNYKKIEQYGERFFEEDHFLQQYRGTMLLKVLTHCLTKNAE